MTYDDEVVKKIHKDSYTPSYGARPIRRYIQDKIETPLAIAMLEGKVIKEAKLVLKDGQISIEGK